MLINTYGDAVLMDDFLSKDTLVALEVGDYEVKGKQQFDGILAQRTRLQIVSDALDNELAYFIQDTKLRKAVAGWKDLAWRSVAAGGIKDHETFVTKFAPGACVDWHVDHLHDGCALSFFIALNEPGGGDLAWNTRAFPIDGAAPGAQFECDYLLPPKLNRLCLFPAWYPHRSLPCLLQRVALHGYLSI